MQPETCLTPRPACAALCALMLALLPACSLLEQHGRPARPPEPEEMATEVTAVAAHLAALQRLIQAPAADQPALVSTAQKEFETNPSPDHQLRYALMLATPGHAGENLGKAEQLLQPLATLPGGGLNPAEQALAIVELHDVQRAIGLDADSKRLTQTLADHVEHDRSVANSRRLQQELDENAKLRKDLEDARAKLDAIANIERGASHPTP